MSYGTALGITLPTVSVTAGPIYATQLHSALTTLINVLESKVTPSGMDISADLDFKSGSTYSAALNLERSTFENKSAALDAASFPTSLYLANGELYYNDNAGNQVQITSDGAVNIASSGGVTGAGYGSGGVEVNWDSGNVKYRLRSGSDTNDFASAHLRNVLMNDGSANTLTLTTSAMGSDYTITFPAAVPASTSLVTMSSSGLLATTLAPSVTSLVTTGTITAGGLITASSGLEASVNEHVKVSGLGTFKHGDFSFTIPAVAGVAMYDPAANEPGVIRDSALGSNTFYMQVNPAAASSKYNLYIPIALGVGERLKSVVVYVNRGTTSGTVTATLYRNTSSVDASTTAAGTGDATLTLTDPSPSALGTTDIFNLRVDLSAAGSSAYARFIRVTYDRP